ncbi:MAG: helix-turn-helix domain-containing protein [Lachnospiraceae bacterium]|nr:helix-turn-helix domain-containing protein [Lachnospiraceae bacterium]
MDHEAFLQEVLTFTEEEEVYRKVYGLRSQPVALKNYFAEIEDYVREHILFFAEFPFIQIPAVFTDDHFTPRHDLAGTAHADIVRHLRYTPVFEYSCTFFEVLYILHGSCGHQLGEEHYTLHQGDLAFIAPGTKRTIEVFDESVVLSLHIRRDTFENDFFNILRGGNLISDFFISSLYSQNPPANMLFPTGDDTEIRDLFLDLYRESLINDSFSQNLLDNLIPVLFVTLLRRHEKDVIIGRRPLSDPGTGRMRILSYISDHYQTATLSGTAAAFHYSPEHTTRLIRLETGKGFNAFLRDVRLGRAQQLLTGSQLSISAISSMIGYENPESFIRVFEKVYGISPARYRKQPVWFSEASSGTGMAGS